jgi:hypothetical protein
MRQALSSRWGQIRHLAKRWWLSVSAGPLSATEEMWASEHLLPTEQKLWERMNVKDRSHAVLVARRFLHARPTATRAEMAGALLHDVGKICSDLGTTSRVVATVLSPRLLPRISVVGALRERCEVYRNHERIGIDLLVNCGSEAETIELLQGHGPAAHDLQRADEI